MSSCCKLISYQATIWKVSASVDVANAVTVDLKDLEKQVQEVTPATIQAMLLDDYQYLICLETEKRDTYKRNYINLLSRCRLLALNQIMHVSLILVEIKVDPTNKALKKQLVKANNRMCNVLDIIDKNIMNGLR